jgi:hypothetical protein
MTFYLVITGLQLYINHLLACQTSIFLMGLYKLSYNASPL